MRQAHVGAHRGGVGMGAAVAGAVDKVNLAAAAERLFEHG